MWRIVSFVAFYLAVRLSPPVFIRVPTFWCDGEIALNFEKVRFTNNQGRYKTDPAQVSMIRNCLVAWTDVRIGEKENQGKR
jgi:hypothetical protein